jgi:hypothetical protein
MELYATHGSNPRLADRVSRQSALLLSRVSLALGRLRDERHIVT